MLQFLLYPQVELSENIYFYIVFLPLVVTMSNNLMRDGVWKRETSTMAPALKLSMHSQDQWGQLLEKSGGLFLK